jgi:hypothetical protein
VVHKALRVANYFIIRLMVNASLNAKSKIANNVPESLIKHAILADRVTHYLKIKVNVE